MSPGGHLVTTAVACVTSAAFTQSFPLTAGIAAGGFLIDIDHAVDYVLFEGQRDLRPGVFLRYYIEGHVRRAVLVLHSYELFAALGGLAFWTDALPLWGYLLGGLMHLALDIFFNRKLTPRSIVAFYSVGYRLAHRFDAEALLALQLQVEGGGFWTAFFRGAVPARLSAADEPTRPEPLAPLGGSGNLTQTRF